MVVHYTIHLCHCSDQCREDDFCFWRFARLCRFFSPLVCRQACCRLRFSGSTRKNGFVTATKLGTTDKIFVAAATKRFVDRTKHFVVVAKCFGYPYFNK